MWCFSDGQRLLHGELQPPEDETATCDVFWEAKELRYFSPVGTNGLEAFQSWRLMKLGARRRINAS